MDCTPQPLPNKIVECTCQVEIYSSVKTIKHICKYVNKGQVIAVFTLAREGQISYNEKDFYQNDRYTVACKSIHILIPPELISWCFQIKLNL